MKCPECQMHQYCDCCGKPLYGYPWHHSVNDNTPKLNVGMQEVNNRNGEELK